MGGGRPASRSCCGVRLRGRRCDKAFAQAKAEQYARLAGRTLGTVQSVNEDIVPGYDDGGYGRFLSGAAFASGGGAAALVHRAAAALVRRSWSCDTGTTLSGRAPTP